MRKLLFSLLVLVLLCQITYSITTIDITETELVTLIPEGYDLDDDEIIYYFTAPVDEMGKWQTTYGDFGEYTIIVTASDGNLSTSEEVLLVVSKKEESPFIDLYSPRALYFSWL